MAGCNGTIARVTWLLNPVGAPKARFRAYLASAVLLGGPFYPRSWRHFNETAEQVVGGGPRDRGLRGGRGRSNAAPANLDRQAVGRDVRRQSTDRTAARRDKDHDCAVKCVKGGSTYVFVDNADKKTYKIANQKFADLEKHAGHTVESHGRDEGRRDHGLEDRDAPGQVTLHCSGAWARRPTRSFSYSSFLFFLLLPNFSTSHF